MTDFDFIIVGAGSAGCVLANRLSADPGNRVLLLEAGGEDRSPLIRVPKGFGKLLGDPNYAWHFPTEPVDPSGTVEAWTRGKTLGGSSAINGLVYNRGHQADWDSLEKLGNEGWNWQRILESYREIEDHQLGASAMRGTGGPLAVSRSSSPDSLCQAMIEAGAAVGMRPVDDMNASDDERIGPAMSTIHRGRRVSAAHAFLHPVRRRPNLQIETGAHATRLLVEGDRAAGVCAQQRGRNVEFRARREVVLCLGSIGTPKLLQLSGIGPSAVLRAAGIDVRVDQSSVGGRMREHRCFPLQARLSQNLGSNRKLATPFAQLRTSLEYLLTRRGPLATPSYDVVGFLKSAPGRDRVDAQILFAPTSVASRVPGENPQIEREPGIHCIGYVLRPTSEGSVHITSADPSAALRIVANYLATPEDQEVGLGVFRRMREMFASDALAPFIERETVPGPSVEDDAALIEMALEHGFCGYHAVGTCAMGPDERDVVDARLRVRGVDQLRVMDCSVLPTMIAGNLNGPMMAMANIAADIILEGD